MIGLPARAAGRSHRGRGAERASSVLYAIVLSPVLLLGVALAVQLGALQLERQRLQSAVDEAVVVAAGREARASSQGVGLDASTATASFRLALAENLAPLAGHLAGVDVAAVARAADVRVITDVPAPDPFGSGGLLRRPTIEARVRAPVRSGMLGLAGLPSRLVVTLTSSADLRRTGGVGT